MAINQLSSANTFQHWLIATQQLITLANNLTDGGIANEFELNTSIFVAGTLRANTIQANVINTDVLYANSAIINIANIEFARINVAHINTARINVATINVANLQTANINTIYFLDGTTLNTSAHITQTIITSSNAYNKANSAYDKANDAYILAGNAYNAANNISNEVSNLIFSAANSAGNVYVVNNTTSTNLFPIMVGSTGAFVAPNATTGKLSFDALNGVFRVSGYYLVSGATGGFYLASRTGDTTPRYSLYSINNNFYVYDHVSTSNRISLKSDGTVGFGVDTPDSTVKIDVYGSIRSSNTSSSNHIGIMHNLSSGIVWSSSNIAFNTAGTQKAKIFTGGGFSVGTNDSPGAGGIYATGVITSNYSDERLKNKLGNIQDALDKVCNLNGFYYEPNKTAEDLGYKVEKQVGVSAQEVQKILPEVVSSAPVDSQYLTVHYERLVPLLIEAIKELKQEVQELKQKLQE